MHTREIAALPYQVARTPLVILDRTVVSRFAEDSSGRIAFDRTFGTLDVLAGRLFRQDHQSQEGAERDDRAGRLARATKLEAEAAQRRRAADEVDAEGRDAAATKRQQAQQRAADGLSEAQRIELEGKQAAAQHAREQAIQAKQRASARGNQKLSTIRQGLKQTEAVAEAREHLAEDKAKAELGEAAKQKAAARRKRSDADALGDLATQQRQQRAKG